MNHNKNCTENQNLHFVFKNLFTDFTWVTYKMQF